jgi:hypothetical protein
MPTPKKTKEIFLANRKILKRDKAKIVGNLNKEKKVENNMDLFRLSKKQQRISYRKKRNSHCLTSRSSNFCN